MKRATAARPRTSLRLRGRSFMAFVLAPSAPIETWLAELDKWSKSSPEFFTGKAIVLDLSKLSGSRSEIAQLVESLGQRGIRVLGLENPERDTVAAISVAQQRSRGPQALVSERLQRGVVKALASVDVSYPDRNVSDNEPLPSRHT